MIIVDGSEHSGAAWLLGRMRQTVPPIAIFAAEIAVGLMVGAPLLLQIGFGGH